MILYEWATKNTHLEKIFILNILLNLTKYLSERERRGGERERERNPKITCNINKEKNYQFLDYYNFAVIALYMYKKNSFVKVSKNLDTDLRIILLGSKYVCRTLIGC